MKFIDDIISKLELDLELDDFIEHIGVVNKKIGDRYFIIPYDQSVKNLSITVLSGKIQSIGITLKEEIQIDNDLDLNSCLFNHYDEETVASFIVNGKFILSYLIDGNASTSDFKNHLSNRLKITPNIQSV